MDATVSAVRDVRTVGPAALAIDVETPAEFDAQPGQFVKLTFDLADWLEFDAVEDLAARGELDGVDDPDRLGPDEPVEVSRFYTISSPDVGETFEITVEVDPEGTVGPVFETMEPGDVVTVSGPFGNDYYEGEERVLLVAGGPGIGPSVGIAERAVADGNEVAVVYRDDEPIHEERIQSLRKDGADVVVLEGGEDLTPAVGDALEDLGRDAQLFVYGFADFIDAATGAIETAGGEAGEAKIENFG